MNEVDILKLKIKEQENIQNKLLNIGIAISAERDLQKLLNLIISELKKLVSADTGTLYLIDHKKNELYFHVTDKETLKEIRLPIDKNSIAGYSALTSEILNIEDVYEIPPDIPYKFNKEIDIKTGYRTKSMLVVPMINHKETTIGVIQLINKMENKVVIPFNEDDLKILRSLASQAAVCIENAQLYKDIENLFDAFVKYSASAIDARDPATAGHSRRVAMYATATAKALGLSDKDIKEIYFAAWLHDIGKIGVKEYVLTKENKLSNEELETIKTRFKVIEEIMEKNYLKSLVDYLIIHGKDNFNEFKNQQEEIYLKNLNILNEELNFILSKNKPGVMKDEDVERLNYIYSKKIKDKDVEIPYLTDKEFKFLKVRKGNLTDEERKNIESHVLYTYDILSSIPWTDDLKNVTEYAASHHEKLNGTGYGKGLKGDEIPLGARILALVDIYEALTAQDRPYKPAMPTDKALRILEEEVKAGHLDKVVFEKFVENKIFELKEK